MNDKNDKTSGNNVNDITGMVHPSSPYYANQSSPPPNYNQQPRLTAPAAVIAPRPYNNVNYQPMTVISSQPQHTTGTKQGEWSVGLCDCFADCNECFCAWCFPCIHSCLLHSRADEGCCSSTCVPLAQLRTKVRVERGIHGSLCNDCCASIWCMPCVMTQVGVEMKRTYPRI